MGRWAATRPELAVFATRIERISTEAYCEHFERHGRVERSTLDLLLFFHDIEQLGR